MNTVEVATDRRKHRRLQLKGDGVALLRTASTESTIVGEIMDISEDGVAFRYIGASGASDGSSELSLVSADHSFYLGSLPIHTVSDIEMAKIPFGAISTRRRGLKFGNLGKNQRFALRHFIRNYTAPMDSAD
ncbi:MAG: hypothetical protein JRI36_04955 [Deltaproteobacteria bacterium]|nr:hypothetical protein [Deltaproteobacteria bacterium]